MKVMIASVSGGYFAGFFMLKFLISSSLRLIKLTSISLIFHQQLQYSDIAIQITEYRCICTMQNK